MVFSELKQEVESNWAPLVGDVFKEAQKLIRQEITLARSEIRQDISEAKAATFSLSFGVFAASLAAVLLSLTVVHLLKWEFPFLPYWSAYGIVGAVFALIAVGFFLRGRKKAAEVDIMPKQTIETMRENAAWVKSKI